MPKVSIIIATYNREHYLKEAILSVLEQTFHDFELIIIDDGSTDNTHSMVTDFSDSRIKYNYQDNQGRSHARNVGINMAQGHYLSFLDSDDLYLPEKLALQVAFMDNHPHIGMTYTSAHCIDKSGNFLRHQYQATVSGAIYKKIAFFVPVTITLPTVMVRREIFSKIGKFDEKMKRFEDTDMWRRISKSTHIEAMNKFTCKLRTHTDNHLHSQNPEHLVDAIHYYAHKLLQENELNAISLHQGLGRFYFHYARAMHNAPHMPRYSDELLEYACRYWPFYWVISKMIKFKQRFL